MITDDSMTKGNTQRVERALISPSFDPQDLNWLWIRRRIGRDVLLEFIFINYPDLLSWF